MQRFCRVELRRGRAIWNLQPKLLRSLILPEAFIRPSPKARRSMAERSRSVAESCADDRAASATCVAQLGSASMRLFVMPCGWLLVCDASALPTVSQKADDRTRRHRIPWTASKMNPFEFAIGALPKDGCSYRNNERKSASKLPRAMGAATWPLWSSSVCRSRLVSSRPVLSVGLSDCLSVGLHDYMHAGSTCMCIKPLHQTRHADVPVYVLTRHPSMHPSSHPSLHGPASPHLWPAPPPPPHGMPPSHNARAPVDIVRYSH